VAKPTICVQGNGIAAACCLQLLQGKGYMVPLPSESSRPPAILASPSTQKLLADVFRSDGLFAGLPMIRQRVVAWGPEKPIHLPHFGVVVSEKNLLDRLAVRLPRYGETMVSDTRVSNWKIVTATSRDPGECTDASHQMRCGTRTATIQEVELTNAASSETCWIEAVEDGWMFLLPISQGRGSLISVASEHAHGLLEASRLIAPLLSHLAGPNFESARVPEFPAYPRIAANLCAEGWLACGSAAMAFDPLCGEGVGNAAREAILACASIAAIEAGEPAAAVLAEYELRLRLGFLRHLENCREFYAPVSPNDFWSRELRHLDEGIAWIQSKLNGAAAPKYRLDGFTLKRREQSTARPS
jgi:hypothetical protein